MIDTTWLLNKNCRRAITIATYVVAAGCVLAGAALGTEGALETPKIHALQAGIRTKQDALVEAIKDSKSLPHALPKHSPDGYEVVQQFQSQAEQAAEANGCTLKQFSAPDKSAAYASVYGPGVGGHNMFQVRLLIEGNLSRILASLQQLLGGNIPFEFSGIDVAPAPSKTDPEKVSASLVIDILTAQEAT